MPTDELNELFDSKYSVDFTETTPKGNNIKGKILLNHGSFHGSLLITELNDERTKQFIRGFPKIKYYSDDMELGTEEMYAYEKLDGTCIGFYELKNNEGHIVEIVPKTRQKAIADEHFLEMLKLCPTYLLYYKAWDCFNNSFNVNHVVYCELFGMLNEHTIPHKQTYVDLRLIGATCDKRMLTTEELSHVSDWFQIPMPRVVAEIRPIISITGNGYKVNGYNIFNYPNIFDMGKDCAVDTAQEIIDCLKKELDDRNILNKIINDYIYYEGVVIQNNYDSNNHYIKVKPNSYFEASGKSALKVPINEIRKEIVKIINENITDYNENYNEKDVIKFINENLAEEYSEEDVENKKVQNVVKKELRKYIDSISDKSVNNVVEELLKEFGFDCPINDIMKYFADKYPMMKHKGNNVYFILNKRLQRGY